MLRHIKRWYHGETRLQESDNDPDSGIWFLPSQHTEYHHWTARLARTLAAFYLRNWQWVWTTLLAFAAVYLALPRTKG